jgi:hypothetical protein
MIMITMIKIKKTKVIMATKMKVMIVRGQFRTI